MTIAIVIHAYYQKQLNYLIDKVQAVLTGSIDVDVDVYVTIPENRFCELQKMVLREMPLAKIYMVDNRGFDILPLATLADYLQKYDWVLKLHTKDISSTEKNIWFHSSVDSLIGTERIFLDTVNWIRSHSELVMVGAMPYFVSSSRLMLGNRANIDLLAQEWGVRLKDDWGFFAGSFYWFKPSVFAPYLKTIEKNQHWFDSRYRRDGSMSHAFERLISMAGSNHGDIGLLLSDSSDANVECYTNQHKMAINNVSLQELLGEYESLDENIKLIECDGVIDIQSYKRQAEISFENDRSLFLHFLLVGQFSDLVKNSYPLYLRQVNRKRANWSNSDRVEGKVSIIIPVYNELKLTMRCLQSVLAHTTSSYEVIVVDNGSNYLTSRVLALYSRFHHQIRVIHLKNNLNFAVGCNIGFANSTGEFVVFLNNDTLVTNNWLQHLIKSLNKQDIIAVQPKLVYPNEKIQSAGVVFGEDGFGKNRLDGEASSSTIANKSTECPALTGACLAMRAHNFNEVKGFDPIFINGQEDIDLCLRLKGFNPKGRFWYCSDSKVYHATSQTQGRGTYIAQNRRLFAKRWFTQ